jgi:hypothetical protein
MAETSSIKALRIRFLHLVNENRMILSKYALDGKLWKRTKLLKEEEVWLKAMKP